MLPRVFVASSSRNGRIIAEAFVRYADKRICKFYPWWDHTTLKYGNSVIDEIVYLCRNKIDYSLIFLTNDDQEIEAAVNKEKPQEDIRISKNCLIEWGISVGALGLDRTICFTTEDPNRFPFDIKNIKFNKFDNPKIEDIGTRNEKIESFINKNKELLDDFTNIIEHFFNEEEIFYLRKPLLEVIPQDILFEFEQLSQPKSYGKLKEDSIVEVALKRPVESSDKEIAKKIIANCEKDIYYDYIYTINEETKTETQTIITKSFLTLLSTHKSVIEEEKIESDDLIIESYKKFIDKLKKRINFYFESSPFTFEYCIHTNVGKEKNVYLKFNRIDTNRKEKIYYARLYDSVNAEEINTVKSKFKKVKEKFEDSTISSFFVKLKANKTDETTLANYNKFIEGLRTKIKTKLGQNGYNDKVIDYLINL